MTFSQFLFKLLFPRYLGLLRSYEMRLELLKAPPVLKAEEPPDLYGGDWELAGYDGANEGDREKSWDPKKCPGGKDWTCNNTSQFFPARPTPAQIAALLATIDYPNIGTCEGDCIPTETFRGECWVLRRNKRTGQFWLYCSKRVAWTCVIQG